MSIPWKRMPTLLMSERIHMCVDRVVKSTSTNAIVISNVYRLIRIKFIVH